MSGAKKKQERRVSQAEMGLTEREKKELKDKQVQRRNSILAAVGGVIAVVLVVALLVWHSGFIPRHTTALTVKDHTFTVADMDYYYHQALNTAYSNEQSIAQFYSQNGLGDYPMSFDPSSDLRTQYVDEEQTQSYHDYFLEQAKTNATQMCALADAAKAAGHTLSADAQSSLDGALSDLESQASQYGFGSSDAYLKAIYGRNMTQKVYLKNLELNIQASDYYTTSTETMGDYSEEELNAYYKENPDQLDSYDYDYVYFDGTAQPTTDAEGKEVEPTQEESAAALSDAKTKAEAMLAAAKAAQTETPAEGEEAKDFSAVAEAQGLSATVRTAQMGSELSSAVYAEWLMDAARADGDTELFEVEGSGYYVVQFHKRYLSADPTVDARHILLSTAMEDDPATADVDESQTPTEAHVAEVKAQAQAILDEYNAGEKTADAFGALAEEHSQDGRDQEGALNAAGGLYEGIKRGDMVKPFEDWCFDPSRAEGDTGLVQTDYGWHIMYFQEAHRAAWLDQAETAKTTDDQNAFLENAESGYEAVENSGWSKVGLS